MTKDVSELSKIKPKGVTLFIGDKERPLRFGFSASAILQEHFGSLTKAMQGLSEMDTNVAVVVDILYALLSIDETVTKEDVAKWARKLEDIYEVIIKIKDVYNSHSPAASDDPTDPTKK